MGSGSSSPLKIGGISGQGGGRILPGTASGVGELIFAATRSNVNAQVAPGFPDRRPMPPFGSTLDTMFTAPGGAPGQPGQGDSFAVYVSLNTSNGTTTPVTAVAGGGGGWGAAGGAAARYLADLTAQPGGNPGAAGGKAIATNGHAITWLGGSARAYGAIG